MRFISQAQQAQELLGELIALEAERKLKTKKLSAIQNNFYNLPLAKIRRQYIARLGQAKIPLALAAEALQPAGLELRDLPHSILYFLKASTLHYSTGPEQTIICRLAEERQS